MNLKILFIVVWIFSISFINNAQQVIPIISTEALKMIEGDKTLVVLDVRTPGEFNQGHIKGAINIDISQTDALSKYDKLDHNAKYLVICRTRNRSGVVANYMSKNGFKTVYQITDGIVGWKANQLPLEL